MQVSPGLHFGLSWRLRMSGYSGEQIDGACSIVGSVPRAAVHPVRERSRRGRTSESH